MFVKHCHSDDTNRHFVYSHPLNYLFCPFCIDNQIRYVLFEIGFNQGELIKNIILERYPNAIVKIYKDYNNLDRIVLIEIGDKNV